MVEQVGRSACETCDYEGLSPRLPQPALLPPDPPPSAGTFAFLSLLSDSSVFRTVLSSSSASCMYRELTMSATAAVSCAEEPRGSCLSRSESSTACSEWKKARASCLEEMEYEGECMGGMDVSKEVHACRTSAACLERREHARHVVAVPRGRALGRHPVGGRDALELLDHRHAALRQLGGHGGDERGGLMFKARGRALYGLLGCLQKEEGEREW
jgi:hypothetical protein